MAGGSQVGSQSLLSSGQAGEGRGRTEDQRRPASELTPVKLGAVLKWVPRGARVATSALLSKLVQNVVSSPQDVEVWRRLTGFAGGALRKPPRGGKTRNLTGAVLKSVAAYASGDSAVEGRGGEDEHRFWRSQGGKPDTDESIARRASSKLGEGDVKGAVRILCSGSKVAACNATNLEALARLHPPSPTTRRPAPPNTTPPLMVDTETVLAAVRSFPSGTAGGPDGLRPQHLRDLLCGGETSGQLLEHITALINLLLTGLSIPGEVRRFVFGGSLMALTKEGGGLRPIAVGGTWRRLASKVCVQHALPKAAQFLAPKLGFGVGGDARPQLTQQEGTLRTYHRTAFW